MSARLKMPERLGELPLLLLPGAALIYLSFNAGGFFAGTPALLAVFLILALIARILLVGEPFEGESWKLAVAAGSLAVFVCWTALSAAWSDSDARVAIEFDRALLYLAALALFGSLPGRARSIRIATAGVAAALVVISLVALATRLLPDFWPIASNMAVNRLSYPITYWNALGILMAIGSVLALHYASDPNEPRPVRIAAAAAVPLLITTLFFTFSRGSIVALAIGLIAYVLLARSPGLIGGLLSTLPTSAIAAVAAYRADELASQNPTGPLAIEQGQEVAVVLAFCCAAAAALRGLLCALDDRLTERSRRPKRPPLRVALVAGAVVAVVAAGLVLKAPQFASDQVDRFVDGGSVGSSEDQRDRLTDVSSNGRVDQWRVALEEGFEDSRVKGTGAGTFELLWAAERPPELGPFHVEDAHSLYLETLSDLGLVGFISLLLCLVALLFGFATRIRRREGPLFAALLAAGLMWCLHAGVDWDWELPATGLWLFMLGGLTLAHPEGRHDPDAKMLFPVRAVLAVSLAILAIVPATLTISQGHQTAAVDAFLDDADCRTAIEKADDATQAFDARPEPFQLRGYCEGRLGMRRAAIASMQGAVDRDPGHWLYHFGLAVVQASAGIDPRPEAARAMALNPLEPTILDFAEAVASDDPRAWKAEGERQLRAPVF